jgi:2-dehydro-3-deoxy-L-rhamnonate dehydrogenase (NAD+)
VNKLDLQNRVAVATGGSGAIGLAIAERFVASGAKVVLWDIDGTAARAAAESGDAEALVCSEAPDATEPIVRSGKRHSERAKHIETLRNVKPAKVRLKNR